MKQEKYLNEIIRYWLEKGNESLEAAQDEMKAGRLSFSVNRIYYACFYTVSALLLQKKLQFKKHSGVRAAFHKHFVKPELVKHEYGQLYDELFEARQRADYIGFVHFDANQVTQWLQEAKKFVKSITLLVEHK